MKSCDRIFKYVFQYHEGTLAQAKRTQVTEHLHQCAICSAKYDRALTMRKALRALPRRHVSSDFNIVLRARLRAETHRAPALWSLPFTSRVWQIPAYAGLALFFISVGVVFQRSMQSPLPGLGITVAQSQMQLPARQTQHAESESRPMTFVPQMKNYVMERVPISQLNRRSRLAANTQQQSYERMAKDSTYELSSARQDESSLIKNASATISF